MRGRYHAADALLRLPAVRRSCGHRAQPTALRWIAALGLVLAWGCRDEGDGGETTGGPLMPAGTGDNEATSTGQIEEPGIDAANQCAMAPSIGAGRYYGTLRGNAEELDGACGLGGPDGFFRLEVPRRSDIQLRGRGVGFLPRIGVMPHTCTTDWSFRTLLCAEGVGAWLLDVPEGASLVVSVGIDPEHPALEMPRPAEGSDPLGFSMDVVLRNVLEVGEPCEPPGRGRCGAGTACLPVPPPIDDPEAGPGPAVCTVLAGDTCATAIELPIASGVTTIELDPADLQTDAHVHSCGGGRRRERVLRLALPGAGPHRLGVRGNLPQVGLAVRAAGCLPEHEQACVAADSGQEPQLTVDGLGELAYLFVELPPEPEAATETGTDGGAGTTGGVEPGEEAPIVVEVELLTAP